MRLLISLDTAPWRAERRWFVRPSASHCNAGGAEGAREPDGYVRVSVQDTNLGYVVLLTVFLRPFSFLPR